MDRLNDELRRIGETRTLIVCGGAALIVSGIIERQTRDMDVLAPEIDGVLSRIADSLESEFGLGPNWLNNGPASLIKDLSPGWRERTDELYVGSNLQVRALGRIDLLATKLYAFCDREDDFSDVLQLKPTRNELEQLKPWVLRRDASNLWPERVNSCFERIRKELKHD